MSVGHSSLWEMVITRLPIYGRIKVLRITLSLELGIHTIGRKACSHIELRVIAFTPDA